MKCCDEINRNGKSQPVTLWYLSEINGYLYSILDSGNTIDNQLVDAAYEQECDSLFVIFKNDNHIYRYDNVERLKDSKGWILL